MTPTLDHHPKLGDNEKGDVQHIEQEKVQQTILQDAIAAEEAEAAMGLRESLRTYRWAVIWSIAISLVIVMDGYDTGLLSQVTGLTPYRQKYGHYSGNPKTGYQLSPAWQTALTESSVIGNFFGIFISSWFQDRYGYRRTIQIFLVLITGLIFIVFYAPTVEVLFVGMFLCGLPWGAFSSSAVAYASEVTPIHLRGYLTTYINLCWVAGQFIASGVLVSVSSRTDEWAFKIPFAVQWVWPIPLFILATLAPESPFYLVRAGRLEDAERSVARLAKRGAKTQPEQIVAMMVRVTNLEKEHQSGTSYFDCFRGTDLRRTEIVCIAWACQILSGTQFANQPTYFFQQAGFNTANSFNLGLGVKALAFIGTCGSWVTMTFFGRRTIFLWGLGTMTLLLLLVGAVAFPAANSQSAAWGQAALIFAWVFVYDFTTGPLAYAIVGEVSSTRLRAKSVGLARNVYNITKIVAGLLATYQINPTAWNWKGKAGFFWAGSAGLAFVWAYFRLPETKGRSFRELDILFERRVPSRKFKETVIQETDEH
ncbi:uncharacterized protein EHS24_003895 [Apiotrichum porosum]|uniref:Major facilitator superfamily (MFS) profile domain-containing protein n=1 Tax=Apiotrichum porosum TaxID=105984 RepID=A0A427XDZ5_9TREE|nr:uncharacterized protein EHS24_003895 [Apiotrichum porosum]RSH76957.1 hypothetical protein EHS24_003895 [Apiotrichum porosum]